MISGSVLNEVITIQRKGKMTSRAQTSRTTCETPVKTQPDFSPVWAPVLG
jgi:hypothetical protein